MQSTAATCRTRPKRLGNPKLQLCARRRLERTAAYCNCARVLEVNVWYGIDGRVRRPGDGRVCMVRFLRPMPDARVPDVCGTVHMADTDGAWTMMREGGFFMDARWSADQYV
jgi:hypothetical protein